MSVTVLIPSVLRKYCEGRTTISVTAADVRACLEEVKRRYSTLYGCICDETGAVRRHVNVFVNLDHIRDRNGLETMLASGDEITILPAVSGG